MEITMAVAIGAVMGMALGLVGTGGAILAVPALVYIFNFSALQATTASLVIVIAAAAVSARARAKAGQIAYQRALVLWTIGLVGNFIGAIASKSASEFILLTGISIIILGASISMWVRSFQGEIHPKERHPIVLPIMGTLIGFIAGFFGVGGAFLVVPTLILAFGVSAHIAAGTGLIVMLLNSTTALLVRYDTWGKVDWQIPLIMLTSAVVIAWFAAEKGTRLKSKSLERGFAGLLLLVGLFTFIETVFLT
ncbi:MAG: sulfite exporter TauE/SafE family protein [Candidatus Nanopelagicaceae bacterium]